MQISFDCIGSRTFGLRIVTLSCLLAPLFIAASASAQIPINVGANPTLDFTSAPGVTEWSTRDTTTGDASTFLNPAAIDAGAQLIDAATVITPLGTSAADGTARLARHIT